MERIVEFLATPAGRWLRIVTGATLVGRGIASRRPGMVAVGALPLLGGLFDFVLPAVLIGVPPGGPAPRAGHLPDGAAAASPRPGAAGERKSHGGLIGGQEGRSRPTIGAPQTSPTRSDTAPTEPIRAACAAGRRASLAMGTPAAPVRSAMPPTEPSANRVT